MCATHDTTSIKGLSCFLVQSQRCQTIGSIALTREGPTRRAQVGGPTKPGPGGWAHVDTWTRKVMTRHDTDLYGTNDSGNAWQP